MYQDWQIEKSADPGFTVKVPPPIRRHVFRDAKCARLTFMRGGASAAGRRQACPARRAILAQAGNESCSLKSVSCSF